jgi:hypothetical protein
MQDMAACWQLGQNVGLGSVKSLEKGQFEILDMRFFDAPKSATDKKGETP